MSDRAFDLNLPGGFIRTKRTFLIFAAALLVLGIAAPQSENTVKLVFIDLTVSSGVLRWLLFWALLYYGAAFLMETLMVRKLNSTVMLGSGLESYDAALKRMASNLGIVSGKVGSLSSGKPYPDAMWEALRRIQQRMDEPRPDVGEVAVQLYHQINKGPHGPLFDMNTLHTTLENAGYGKIISSGYKRHIEGMAEEFGQYQDKLKGLTEALHQVD